MGIKKYNIFNNGTDNWDEGLPLGNGKCGCIVYGKGPIKLAIDRVDLWDVRPNERTLSKDFNYKTLVQLSKSESEQDWQKRVLQFERIYREKAYPSKITAGRIELDIGTTYKRIKTKLDLQTAIATINAGDNKIIAFMHATRDIGIVDVFGKCGIDFHIPTYISDCNSLDYPQGKVYNEGDFICYVQQTKTNYSYGVTILKRQIEDGHIRLFFAIGNTNDGDFELLNRQKLVNAANSDFDFILQEHILWWKRYWKKSSICLGDTELEKTYYRSWYLFASCSRKGSSPMPLQGVWTADNNELPPWKGDYHFDTNVQLSYQGYLKANRVEEGQSLIDYLLATKPAYEKFAKTFFGVKGLIIPGSSAIDGSPMGGWPQNSYSPTMSIWMAQSLDEYFLYTGDVKFLRHKAYPFFLDIATAIEGILEEKNGKLYLPLSTSPEIYDNTRNAYLKPNSNFDLSLLIYLYKTLIKYAKILKRDSSRFEVVLNKLDDIAIVDDEIALDSEQLLTESHRHFSHLMCLYPLHLINYDSDKNKTIYKKSIEKMVKLGSSMWVGFSFPMCAQIYAMMGEGKKAIDMLKIFTSGFVGENGFHLNGDFKDKGYSTFKYRPFTLEALFGYCDAIQEMLVQQHQGYIHLFPCGEQMGTRLSFKNFRVYDGVKISAIWNNGTMDAILTAKRRTKISLKNNFNGDIVVESRGNKQVLSGDIVTFTIERGKTKIKAC